MATVTEKSFIVGDNVGRYSAGKRTEVTVAAVEGETVTVRNKWDSEEVFIRRTSDGVFTSPRSAKLPPMLSEQILPCREVEPEPVKPVKKPFVSLWDLLLR